MKLAAARYRPARLRSRSRVRIAGAATAAVALLLAGCHAGTSSASGGSVTVASVPSIGNASLFVAVQDGLFRQAGLTVHVRSYPTVTSELSAVRSGQADVAIGDYASFFYAQEHYPGSPMVVVADGYDAGPNAVDVLVPPGSPITSPQQLAGKTIGTAKPQLMPVGADGTPYSLETVSAASVLTNDGVQPGAVHWRPMPANELIGALGSHRVDAILVTEPLIYRAESHLGAQSLLDACSGATVNLPLDGYFASRKYASQNAGTLAAFKSALMEAQADAARRSPVQSALSHYDSMTPQIASLITLGLYPTSLKVTSLQRVANLMAFYGVLRHSLSVSNMIFKPQS
jgi:ABC-type nitrate/sulfonate/bicarbonate transport system substrate-binding protein